MVFWPNVYYLQRCSFPAIFSNEACCRGKLMVNHRLTYVSTQLSLTALFFNLNLDFFYEQPEQHPMSLGEIQLKEL